MKVLQCLIAIVFLNVSTTICLYAQGIHESTNTAGGNAAGSGGSVSYSAGQIVYTTNAGTNGTVSQGIQQPFEISVVTELEEAKGIRLSMTAFPNPANDHLTLKIDHFNNQNLSFQLYDINGKMILESKIILAETQISMEEISPSIYFLKITDNGREVKEFKIVKTEQP